MAMKKINIEPHTLQRMEERGVEKAEVIEVIRNGKDFDVKYNRHGKYKIFDFNDEYLGKYYRHKRVEVIYIEEDEEVVTVTVMAFYGKWEERI